MSRNASLPMIQVAGIRSLDEARMLMRAGVEFLGFPLRLDVHKPDTSEEEAALIVKEIRPPHTAVVITYLDNADEILDFVQQLGVIAVQIHGDIARPELERLRREAPHLFLIKSLVVGAGSFGELQECVDGTVDCVDAYITDTFDPRSGARGATGMIHDWSVSRKIVESTPKPVILAGGLNPKNVAEAIRAVAPAGVDVHTGVEDTYGNKDPQLVREFIAAARAEFAKLPRNI